MMTLYELTKKYGEGKGEDMMWKTVHIISDAVESNMDEHAKNHLIRSVFGAMSDKHYTEELAHGDVAGMYYIDANGDEHRAPYWPADDVRAIYDDNRDKIPGYNFWDFYVTMNMLASDSWCMLKKWFPGADESDMTEKITEMAVNWLSDEDWPTKTKIWDYLSAK